jgi:hypothetical protein
MLAELLEAIPDDELERQALALADPARRLKPLRRNARDQIRQMSIQLRPQTDERRPAPILIPAMFFRTWRGTDVPR